MYHLLHGTHKVMGKQGEPSRRWNKDSMKIFQPVSNLSFLSKVLEKVVMNQLNSHLNNSGTSNRYQSAYRKFHSTETARLKIHSDILASTDAGKVTALTLLDLSTSFHLKT